ncbi:MAG: 1-acyl-sn-glycerol-3-phosphate acyltransferase [Polyangiaceae bacterium]|nr:1-acyl-sn-glycerol-3-phosphate acyltransferase [Polyangiaceae bacterium]
MRRSLVLTLQNTYEVAAIAIPTVLDAVRGRLTGRACDARIDGFAKRVIHNTKMTVRVHGRENVPPKEDARSYVVMSNHVSNYDIPVLYYVLGGHMRMIAKKELFAMPIFGRAMREAKFIEIDRTNRNRAVTSLAQAKTEVLAGTPMWIAPEGTRSPTGELLPFKLGGFVLALDLGAPILPVTIRGTRDVCPTGSLLSTPGLDVDVFVHPMIESSTYAGLDPKKARRALLTEVRNSIASALS